MLKKVFIGVSVLVLAALTTQAIEDGLGTNVVRSLRVNDGGTMTLGGTAITNWYTMPVGTGAVNLVDYLATNAVFQGATNVLNTSVTNVSYQVTNVLYGATGALNTAVGLLQGATNVLNLATNALQVQAKALQDATNALNSATNTMNANKLDRVGGTAGNLTVTGAFVQAVATSTQVVSVAGAAIPVTDTFIPIVSGGGNLTASIASGGTAGRIIILQGQNDTDTVTLTNNPNLVLLEDDVSFTFKKDNTMQLIWNNGKWAELGRIAR